MDVDLNNSSISSPRKTSPRKSPLLGNTPISSTALRGAVLERGVRRCEPGRDTALQIATRSNRTGDDEEAHQQALCRSRHSDRHGEKGISNETLKNLETRSAASTGGPLSRCRPGADGEVMHASMRPAGVGGITEVQTEPLALLPPIHLSDDQRPIS